MRPLNIEQAVESNSLESSHHRQVLDTISEKAIIIKGKCIMLN